MPGSVLYQCSLLLSCKVDIICISHMSVGSGGAGLPLKSSRLETRDAGKYPTIQRTAPNFLSQNVNNAKVENAGPQHAASETFYFLP